MSTERGHSTSEKSKNNCNRSTSSLRRLESPFVLTKAELNRGLFLSFGIGVGLTILCFLIFFH